MLYTLYLASSQGILDLGNSQTQQVSWNVNWDSFFKGTNKMFRKCRVKYHFLYNEIENGVSIGQQYTPTNRSFYLSANFSSDSQTSNKAFTNTSSIQGVVLGLIRGINVETDSDIGGSSIKRNQGLVGNTLNADGITILCPQGTQRFTLYLNPLITGDGRYTSDWNIILQFILDEDDD